jgi:hypothetical protein
MNAVNWHCSFYYALLPNNLVDSPFAIEYSELDNYESKLLHAIWSTECIYHFL